MSATDTKKTPKSTGYVKIPSVAYIETMQYLNKCEADLTAVTAQRDRALGLLERMAEATYMLYSFPGQGMVQCDVCGAIGEAELNEHPHEDGCEVKQIDALLAEYEALRKEQPATNDDWPQKAAFFLFSNPNDQINAEYVIRKAFKGGLPL